MKKSKDMEMIKKMILAGILSLLLVTTGCSTEENQTESASPKAKPAKLVRAVPVQNRILVEKLNIPGTIKPENVANVLATSEGKISQITAREGDIVKNGDLLARISSLIREDIINSAQLLAESKKENLEKNPDDPALKQAYKQALENLEFAKEQYKEIAIIAPMSGVLSKRWVDLGDMISARTKLFEIQSNKKLRVDIAVPETDLQKLKEDQEAKIIADACPDNVFTGHIQRIHPQVDTYTRNGIIEIALHDPCQNLKPGMFVRTSFITRQLENAIAIPLEAVVDRPQNKTCFVIEKGKAVETVVEIGLEEEGWVEVLSGLALDDLVVVEGQQQLKTGTAVKIQKEKKSSKEEAVNETD